MSSFKALFEWGDWNIDLFVFKGVRYVMDAAAGQCQLDMEEYSRNLAWPSLRNETPGRLNKRLQAEFRSCSGSGQWLCQVRGDVAAWVSLLQVPVEAATLDDLKAMIGVLRYVKATPKAKLTLRKIKDPVVAGVGDAGLGNAPGGKSQGGFLVALADRSCLHGSAPASLWDLKTHRLRRVTLFPLK